MPRFAEALFPGAVQAVVQRSGVITQVHYRDVTGSTNDDLVALARSGAPHGTLVVADAQRSGRGRQGRSWHSPPGKGLWMSLLLRPNLTFRESFWISGAAGVAVAEAAARTAGAAATLRWPNDVLVKGRKLAGTLADAAGAGRLDYIVLGVGFNVNQEATDFPEEIRDEAISLRLAGGHALDRALVLAAFLESFEFHYRTLERDQGASVRREWLRLCTLIGRKVSVAASESVLEGTAAEVLADGALVLDTASHGRVEVRAGDVRLLREVT